MKKIFLIAILGIFTVTCVTGCGMLKGSKSPEELAAMENAAIRGEDIPLSGIPDSNFMEPHELGITGVFEDIHFDYDKSTIQESDYVVLNEIGGWMKDNPSMIIMIEGHCDERGSNEYNMALGEQRALSVRRYVVGLGVDADRIYTVSYGEESPINPGHNNSAWAKNRRAHFLVGE